MFNPSNLDEVCIQETYIETKGKNNKDNFSKKPFKPDGNKSKGKGKGKHTAIVRRNEINLHVLIVRRKVMMLPNVRNFIQSSSLRSFGIKKKKRLL